MDNPDFERLLERRQQWRWVGTKIFEFFEPSRHEEGVNGFESIFPKRVLALGRGSSRKKLGEPPDDRYGGRVSSLESIVGVRKWYRCRYAWRWADVSREEKNENNALNSMSENWNS